MDLYTKERKPKILDGYEKLSGALETLIKGGNKYLAGLNDDPSVIEMLQEHWKNINNLAEYMGKKMNKFRRNWLRLLNAF